LSALAALILRGYIRHLRVVQAEEPIGVPIGVTDASASATPVTATTADPIVSIVRQPTLGIVDANTTQPVLAKDIEPDSTLPTPEPTPVTANNLSTLPATIDSSRVVSTSEAATTPAPSPNAETSTEDQETAPKKIIMHEVRRAQPADEEESPAEPSPPGEGPAVVTPAPTASPGPKSNSVTPTEQSRDVTPEPARKKSRKPKRPEPDPTILLKVPRPDS
jgi:hypothetical protein